MMLSHKVIVPPCWPGGHWLGLSSPKDGKAFNETTICLVALVLLLCGILLDRTMVTLLYLIYACVQPNATAESCNFFTSWKRYIKVFVVWFYIDICKFCSAIITLYFKFIISSSSNSERYLFNNKMTKNFYERNRSHTGNNQLIQLWRKNTRLQVMQYKHLHIQKHKKWNKLELFWPETTLKGYFSFLCFLK